MRLYIILLAGFFHLYASLSTGNASILTTKHNLSVSGPGEVKALSEERVCIFCHTPHNASPQTPLWNKEVGPVNYILYESSTLQAIPTQPMGPSRLCLTCHDGLIALGNLLTGQVTTTGEITPERRSYIGTDLADDHPISFSYLDSAIDPEIVSPPPNDPRLIFYGDFSIECSTCHDAHEDNRCDKGYDCKFLVMNNQYSALCTKCHNMDGWQNCTKTISSATWNGIPPNPWSHTEWLNVAENGCENCHKPHTAGEPKRLLNYVEEEWADFEKASHHPVENTIDIHEPDENPLISGHVECEDCHNPHAHNERSAEAPDISGGLEKVKGVDRDGAAMDPARYEYEVCFKCHADTNSQLSFVQRVVDETNTRIEFSLSNPSYHPVIGIGKNLDVPSIPSTLEPDLLPSDIIYCTDCHDSDSSPEVGGSGARGPHGSNFAPILRERYETDDFTPESYESFALCYRCHNRDSILFDESFPEHNEHISEEQVPCSACHDPHGVRDDAATGSHTHLINFDTNIVEPLPGQLVPFFTDNGSRSGSCTLRCHNVDHTGTGEFAY
jgi:hypothetical protein